MSGHTRPLIGQYLTALTSDWLKSAHPIPRQSVCMNRVRSGQNCVQQSGESLRARTATFDEVYHMSSFRLLFALD